MITRRTTTLHHGRRRLLVSLLALGGLAPLASGLAQPVPPTAQQPADPAPLLQTEDRGPLVNQLQTELANLGLFSGVVNGHYGPDTAAAVRSLQAQQGLVVDGIAGPQTWRALEAAQRAATLPPPLLTANLVTFTPLVVAQPNPPPPAIWLALMPLVPIAGGALTCLHRRRQRVSLPFKPKL
ncbi:MULTISPECIES: peptidoglycan-binding domain-containing protein [Cyanophyceae]|uniref:peptidoglycan-binding domain-containing protein n=1 Tax=Cyanophyceae TaxID=3028117 RepID=UPI001682C538|nr:MULTISPECIES: peptidoglycan-binding domain-containing protein [Cyanophyceae]MBD1919072.1 peptidoglycan-binding protein [Phormidium sp. FACHB-77]MBD2033073.1 peptidoglycan-binding protein [Phormidium sp. FACHB-322]MBD2054001.1 peptidoglycan-binding protein [Leptolyngbya sp. FACHB-60]